MYLTDEDIRRRYENLRPGATLGLIEEAALPVTLLSTVLLTQESKGLALVDEFLLRAVDSGLRSPSAIASLLGVSTDIIQSSIVEQCAIGNLLYKAASNSLRVSERGRLAAKALATISPKEVELPLPFDRTIWRVNDYSERDLVSRREAEAQDMRILPASQTIRISKPHLRIKDIEQIVNTNASGKKRFQLLSVQRVSASRHLYLPIKVLHFLRRGQQAIDHVPIVDGMTSPIHDHAFVGLGLAQAD